MLLLTKSKGYMSNVHYSGFPKHLQTKSNLHISISQSKLKHKYLPLDTLYFKIVPSGLMLYVLLSFFLSSCVVRTHGHLPLSLPI